MIAGLSIFLGVGMGFLIVRGEWFFAIILALLMPGAFILINRPFLGVFLWLLLMPLSSALPNPELMYWGIHRILIPLTLVLTIISRFVHTRELPPIHLGFPEICILLLAIYTPLSLAVTDSVNSEPLRKYLDRFIIPFLMYLAVRLSTLDKRNLKGLEITAFVVAVIQSGIGFMSWIMPSMLPRVWHHLVGYRTGGSLGDPAVFTSLLVFCAVILIHASMQRNHTLIRLMYLLVSGACFVGVFISLERGSWLAGVLVLAGLVVLYRKRMLRLILLGGLAMILLGAGLLSRQVSMAIERFGEQHPIDDRIVVTDAMIQMILEKPVFGWGYDRLNVYMQDYYRQVGSASIAFGFTTSHNTYLTIFTELGLVGFLLYSLPVIWLFLKSAKAWRGPPPMNQPQLLLLFTFWFGALQNFAVSNFMDMRFFPIGLTLWWLTLGLIENLLNQSEYDQKRKWNRRGWTSLRGSRFGDGALLGDDF